MAKSDLDSFPVDFWRSLYYFNLYRLALSSFFVFLAATYGVQLSLGARNWELFYRTSIVYVVVALLSFILLKVRWPRFTWQLALQVSGDVLGLTVLSYASGGIQSSIGSLLLISLAAAGMISRGKITLFFAAMASIAALLEHAFAVLYDDASGAQFVQVGLLSGSFFAVAWLAHTLAQYAVDSQQLAQRRGQDLASLAEANRLVMRDMQDGVLVVDEHGEVVQMNPSAARLLHRTGMSGGALAQDFPLLYGQYALWRQTGEISRDTLLLDDGVQARLYFAAVEGRNASGAVIFLQDMQRVQAAAQQIKLAALGRLTANIAHEVRNPLSAISYATELLKEESTDAQQQHLLQIVLDNTQRINQIVQDVMQLNRRDRAQPEVFALPPWLEIFIAEFAQAQRHALGVLQLESTITPQVHFDRGHLQQVLGNLCANALRHSTAQLGSVRLQVTMEGERVVLCVVDDGAGIKAEHRAKLFEPFFTTAAEGTGLGLYIAKELCEANAARLEYRDREDQAGACFCVLFAPLAQMQN